MTEADRDALRAWLELLSASNGIKKFIDTSLRREFGVSISRFDILSALERAGADGLRAGDLSQQLMVTEGNTTQVTAPLIRDGLVKRAPCTEDGRVAIFRLTRKGEKLFREMAAENRLWVADAFSTLSENQLKSFRRLLGMLSLPGDNAGARNRAPNRERKDAI